MENDEIKLTKKQIKEMDVIMRIENALIASERVHIAAMAQTHQNLEDSKRKWWLAVAGDHIGEGWMYDGKTKLVKRTS